MDSGVDVGLGGATVLVGVGLGVAFGVAVGLGGATVSVGVGVGKLLHSDSLFTKVEFASTLVQFVVL